MKTLMATLCILLGNGLMILTTCLFFTKVQLDFWTRIGWLK